MANSIVRAFEDELKPLRYATLFTGCGGADCGLRAAGLKHVWGVELNEKAAAIARLNGFATHVKDILATDFAALPEVDWLHASPPCQQFSAANSAGKESANDIALAKTIIKAVEHQQPGFVSLENVRAYKNSQSFLLIQSALLGMGYAVASAILNSADYGVPQTRKRLWMVACRTRRPTLPMPTHYKPTEQGNLFLTPWVGWGDVLGGLPAMEPRKLSARMQQRMPKEDFAESLHCGINKSYNRRICSRFSTEPAPTMLATMDKPTLMPWAISRVNGQVNAAIADILHTAAWQSFPPSYRFGNSRTAARRAIGNAVPPLLMQKIAEANLQA